MFNEKLYNEGMNLIHSYKPISKYDYMRLDEMNSIMERYINGSNDDGSASRVIELTSHDSNSPIVTVRPQGKADFYIRVNGKRQKCECKSKGGDITSIMDGSIGCKYIRVYMDFYKKPNKVGYIEHCHVDVVMLVSTYKALVTSLNAFRKQTNPKHNNVIEYHQQADSNKLYKALQNFPPFVRGFDYVLEDFED